MRLAPGLLALAISASTATADAVPTVWKRGGTPATIDEERAVLGYDRASQLEHLVFQATLVGDVPGAHLVFVTTGRATFAGAPLDIFEKVGALRALAPAAADGGADGREAWPSPSGSTAVLAPAVPEPPSRATAESVPTIARVFPQNERQTALTWMATEGLEGAPRFLAFLDALPENAWIAFVAAPPTGPIIFSASYRTEKPHYPRSAPLVGGARWPTLELWLVSETPLVWDGAGAPALEFAAELPGSTSESLPLAARTALGLERPRSTLWLGRHEVAREDRSRSGDVHFTASVQRVADQKIRFLAAPFASVGSSEPSPSAAPSASRVAGAEDRPETLSTKGGRKGWGRSSVGGAAIFVIGLVALAWSVIRRKMAS